MISYFKIETLSVTMVLAMAASGCGGSGGSGTVNTQGGLLNPLGLYTLPRRVAIAQGSSESIMLATGGGVATAPIPCPTQAETTVQVSGLPSGVTVSPSPLVIPANCSPVALTISVGSSAIPASATLTLAGTSGSLSAKVSLPFEVMAETATSTAKCSASPAPAPLANSSTNEWIWTNGSDTTDQPGAYGSLGVAARGNSPGARVSAATWTDQAGNLWLFGGYGAGSSTNLSTDQGDLSDLWSYANGEWTWKGGSNQIEQPGAYGTKGVASTGNTPGARWLAAYWTDHSGNFWIFGGLGLDANGTRGHLNDLWQYTVATGQWTWISGPNTVCPTQNASGCPGVYGDLGVPSANNVPGARVSTAFWTDSCGNLWLFGGQGADSTGTGGNLNDLWEFDPTTKMWTWKGGVNIVGQNGTYGTLSTASAGNVPGSRSESAAWTDHEGNLWLFGGVGGDVNGLACATQPACELNDLWKYDPAAGTWSWIGGSDTANQVGNYGTRGDATSANIPGARDTAVSWTDDQGNLWLFGGNGFGASTLGDLNDLWEYTGGQWIWINGSNQAGQLGSYGSLGVPVPGNVPGARNWAAGWSDQSGNLWMFGGDDSLAIAHGGKFNDLWEYQP